MQRNQELYRRFQLSFSLHFIYCSILFETLNLWAWLGNMWSYVEICWVSHQRLMTTWTSDPLFVVHWHHQILLLQSTNSASDPLFSLTLVHPIILKPLLTVRLLFTLDFVTENCDYSTTLYHLPSGDYGDEPTWHKFIRNLNSKFELNFGILVASLG